MTNDELISAHLDGQLSERERAAFEHRLYSDAALRREVNVMRYVIRSVQQLPVVALPRNFSLPASMAQPEHNQFDWRLLFRMGSACAAVLFVALVALDLSQGLSRPALQVAPVAAPALAPAPQAALPNLLVTHANAEAASLPAGTQLSVIETTQITQLPVASRSPPVASDSAIAAPQARATKSLNSLSKLTPTMAATALPIATVIELTPMPTLASVVPTDVSETWATWPRLLAGVALLVGAALTFLGWRR